MAVYRYPLPSRRYRRGRYPYRYRRGSGVAVPPWLVITAVVIALAGAGAGTKAVTSHAHAKVPAAAGSPVPAEVIAFARAQLGKPYAWGGTGPGAFDCSGLMLMAYRSAGVDIPRTSQDQWALLPHVPASQVRPGDLVFFPGSDGTWAAPGHVAMVISKTRMIQAYATGTPVEVSPLNRDGAGGIVGYARPREPRPPAAAAGSEAAFMTAVLSALSAPATAANLGSLAAWYRREYPSWPPAAAGNPLDTTLAEPGSWNFNTFGGGLHVQSYPTAAEGEQATAATLLGGYPLIVAALRSGAGICGAGFAGELAAWSGNGYQEVC